MDVLNIAAIAIALIGAFITVAVRYKWTTSIDKAIRYFYIRMRVTTGRSYERASSYYQEIGLHSTSVRKFAVGVISLIFTVIYMFCALLFLGGLQNKLQLEESYSNLLLLLGLLPGMIALNALQAALVENAIPIASALLWTVIVGVLYCLAYVAWIIQLCFKVMATDRQQPVEFIGFSLMVLGLIVLAAQAVLGFQAA